MLRARLCGLLLILALAGVSAAGGAPVVLNTHPWPPFFYGPEAEPPGFAQEILEICIVREGREIEHADLNIKRMFDALEQGSVDVHVMSRKPEREELVFFGEEPLFSAVYRPVVRKGRNVEIDEVSDFDGLRIGHMDGLTYAPPFGEYIADRIARRDGIDAVAGDEQMERLLQMVATERIDVTVNMTITVRRAARDLGLLDRIEILPLEIQRSDYLVVASRASKGLEDPEAFLGRIDACIRDLRESGRYAELEESYGFAGD